MASLRRARSMAGNAPGRVRGHFEGPDLQSLAVDALSEGNALEAIIKLLVYISLFHDKCLLFMLELY